MKTLIRLIICLLASFVFLGTVGAVDRPKNTSTDNQPVNGTASGGAVDRPKNAIADNSRMDKQALESVITRIEECKESNHPAHNLYGIFPDSLVNPYKISVAQMPDSIRFDCSDYVAPIENYVTSRFGPRGKRYHYGIDIKLNVGDTLVSPFDGQVRVTHYDKNGYGYYIVLRHNNGLETVLGHLSGYIVQKDAFVKAGQPIALGGNTGRSTGPHVHFEIRFLGNPINPEKLIDFEAYVPKQDSYLMVKANDFKYQTVVPRYYTVKSGDTLSHIAARTGTSVAQLRKLNNLGQNSVIRPGQKIRYS